MLIFVKMALSSSDYGANISTISDFWDLPSRPSLIAGATQKVNFRIKSSQKACGMKLKLGIHI